MALSQSAMFLFLETNSVFKYELMLAEEAKKTKTNKPTSMPVYISEYSKLRKDPKKFFQYTHMDIKVFNYILECVRDKMKRPFKANKPKILIRNPEDRLFITIRFMASELSLAGFSRNIGFSRKTTVRIISSTLTAIWKTLHNVHLKPPTPDEMPAAADKFFTKWQFPNAVGAIGAKYIPTKVMLTKRRKGIERALPKISLVLTAVADADFRFSAIDVTRDFDDKEERTFDDIFGNAGFRELPGTTDKTPYVILGNETFPLLTHLLRPYYQRYKPIPDDCATYNYQLAASRLSVNVAFQILTEKFPVFGKPIILDLERVGLVVRAGCLLYNIVKDIDGDFDPHFRNLGMVDKGYLNLYTVKKRYSRHPSRSMEIAIPLRDLFKDYICQHNL